MNAAFTLRGASHVVGWLAALETRVLAITNVTFPTIWAWMRAGKFPRARVVGGQSKWLSTEIEAWLAALPSADLKEMRRKLRLAKSPLAWS